MFLCWKRWGWRDPSSVQVGGRGHSGSVAHGHQVPPISWLPRRKASADVFAPNCMPRPCYVPVMACALQGTGAPEHVLLAIANILLLFAASAPARPRRGSSERSECGHAGERHASLLGGTPGWRATPPRHTPGSRNASGRRRQRRGRRGPPQVSLKNREVKS